MMSKMEFECKIAHCNEIKRLSGFSSIKELYEKVGQAFSVPNDDILFCTLNTHDYRDMNSLLGNYLSLGDLIVVHLCGSSKSLSLKKTQEYLGLTITDNGQGRAFVKKVKSNDGAIEHIIKPGDHIAAIDSKSTIGMRHYEVAKSIRAVPENTTFTLHLIEPLHSENSVFSRPETRASRHSDSTNKSLLNFSGAMNEDNINQLLVSKIGSSSTSPSPDSHLESSFEDDLVNSSLPIDRLLSKETYNSCIQIKKSAGVVQNPDSYRVTIDKINSILESFLGINDNLLAIQIYRLAKENQDSFDRFSKAIKSSELSVFNFDNGIETYLWNCAMGSEVT